MANNVKMPTVQLVVMFLVFALALFLPAGTLAWFAGWCYLLLFFGFAAGISLWLLKYNPALLRERMVMFSADQKSWDKVLFALIEVVVMAWLVLMPLDAVRFHWSYVPGWLQIVGGLLLVSSFFLFFLTFRENSFLSPMVRLQQERGQTVVSTGPYHYVRHPMYAGILLFVPGTALLLGSWYGLLAGVLIVVMVARRAVLEEQTLQAELPGYDAYMEQVKYRFVPYIW
jgi:protein-S-isoprenylcysteine O-methyltransferase Ste14